LKGCYTVTHRATHLACTVALF
jgi:hypothetical protein